MIEELTIEKLEFEAALSLWDIFVNLSLSNVVAYWVVIIVEFWGPDKITSNLLLNEFILGGMILYVISFLAIGVRGSRLTNLLEGMKNK